MSKGILRTQIHKAMSRLARNNVFWPEMTGLSSPWHTAGLAYEHDEEPWTCPCAQRTHPLTFTQAPCVDSGAQMVALTQIMPPSRMGLVACGDEFALRVLGEFSMAGARPYAV